VKGCVYKRTSASGAITWAYSIDAGKDESGKRVRQFHGGYERKKDAEAELARILQEIHDGLLVRPTPKTFGEFMGDWFHEHAQRHCSPKTAERYRQLWSYADPMLSGVQLREVNTLMLERLYNRLRDSGGRVRSRKAKEATPNATRPLSARTVRHVAGLIHVALNTAVRWKLLKINPAAACQLPRLDRKEARALDPKQTEWLLSAAQGHWLYPIIVLALATGCRRGELLALTWPDVRLDSTPGVLAVSKSLEQTKAGLRIKTPKNGKTRAFPLPAVAVEAMKAHRETQEQARKLFGNAYRADLNLVFAGPDGDYLKPDSVTAAACLLARKIGLPGAGLHSLRHSHASQLLSAGVPLPAVSKRLGHSSVNITAQIYSHAFTADEIAAAESWDAAMGQVVKGSQTKQ
jgi:integrase